MNKWLKETLLVLSLCLLSACTKIEKPASLALNLEDSSDNLTAFLKMRASLEEGKEVVYWWTGKVYSFMPQQRGKLLFDFEGYNIARLKEEGAHFQLLTKEASFYKDVESGAILESWFNPFIEDTVEVVQVWNDPVNMEFKKGQVKIPYTNLGNDHICMNADILLAYPSQLSRKDYPKNSKSDIYQSAELFQFFVDKKDLDNAASPSAYAELSWTRVGDWLPWMEMGSTDGYLIYQCRGYKLENGYQDLPNHIKEYVEKHQPEFTKAPTEYTKPNETSWSYYKKMHSRS